MNNSQLTREQEIFRDKIQSYIAKWVSSGSPLIGSEAMAIFVENELALQRQSLLTSLLEEIGKMNTLYGGLTRQTPPPKYVSVDELRAVIEEMLV